MARDAERAGADGLLLFPPYLTEASQEGLAAHVRAVCAATGLGVTVYSRANAVYQDTTVAEVAEDCPTLVGFKDGVGDLELMTRVRSRLGDRLVYIGGLPTAETFALPYLELGVTTYSSAIFNFVPEFALAFYAAVRAGDRDEVRRRLAEFVLPYCDIRNRRKGYAVSIIKAGLRVTGAPAGPRPPAADGPDRGGDRRPRGAGEAGGLRWRASRRARRPWTGSPGSSCPRSRCRSPRRSATRRC
ncbi:5-dehydro-4-deoxyglucarate dehydratase [Actinomadura madurae]|uniref:5-dehydro-4-deoxyglucarate dehydratase n=1 Tax=Actinomadura madurae TaxID=1993 RepID=UPI0020D2115B|nr:5-dehydro-4-deoxyglucarate dehydratase [Actinomadura madurae]